AAIVNCYRQLDASQWWTPEMLRQWQFTELARLVEHARQHVPFYADALKGLRTDSTGAIDEDAWKSLPILTKEHVRADPGAFRARQLSPGTNVFSQWGTGSTGIPIEVVTTLPQWQLFHAVKLRLLQWHDCDPHGKLCEILPFSQLRPGSPVQRLLQWGGAVGALLKTGEVARMKLISELPAQLAFLEAEKPEYLLTFPSHLQLLLRAFRKTGKRLPSLRMVRTLSECLDPYLWTECQEVLGVPLVDTYGATECGYLGVQCPEQHHYHVQSEGNLVEVLAPDGSLCGPGETGRVVVTPLHALAMPLLRYDLGDLAEVGEPCACGRGLPVLTRIHGRMRDMLTLPSGRKISGSILLGPRVFASMPVVARYQIVQKKRQELEVRIVADRALEDAESQQIIQRLVDQIGADFAIRVVEVDDIPRLPSGKSRDFVSEIEPAGSN
ncbi:MAG: AMP-binding protein, partial [Chthoniobacter sp.]|uniref:phenylacetate--CoA ligase family protein n=1 Tax=Chthoniobacter sp. TaxID=2510640 RepID=UPI0032AAF5F4